MRNPMRNLLRELLLTGALALAGLLPAAPAAAQDWDMIAAPATLTMPDGKPVTMWGLAMTGDLPFAPLTGVPVLREAVGATLTINLINTLPVATSLVIPGQNDTTMTPVFFADSQGRSRARSFTHETPGGGGAGTYTWNNLRAGTYLIHSGTHPGVQVPMGLYAVLVVDGATPDAVLLFSEVDSLQHLAVAGDPTAVPPVPPTYGTIDYPTSMAAGYGPDYFLINGRPWGFDRSAIPAGSANTTIPLRFLNAGISDRVAVLQNQLMTLVAEDGNTLPSTTAHIQHSVDLPPMKTMEATFTPATPGYYPVSDRRLGVTNNNTGPGGMLAYLQVGATDWTLDAAINAASTGTGTVRMASAPGGIEFANFPGGPIDGTEDLLDGTVVTLSGMPRPGTGSMLTGWAVSTGAEPGCLDPYGDCVVTMDADKTVTATFTTFTQVTLLTPNGTEAIPSGSGYTIRWGAPVGATNFTLAYSFGAGTPWQTITTGVTGNSYVWAVPDKLPDYGSLYVAVIGYDAAGIQIGMDVSDGAANRSSVALLTPSAAGIVVTGGLPYNITWSNSLVTGDIAYTGLWYQTAAGTPWQIITLVAGDPGTYTWTVPATPTTTARVGVIFYDPAGTPLHMDVSDNTFTIQP